MNSEPVIYILGSKEDCRDWMIYSYMTGEQLVRKSFQRSKVRRRSLSMRYCNVNHWRYKQKSAMATSKSVIVLPGQYYDEETNLHYNMFRYYDP